jgi:orotidine-5'-phosphate decarboxylase
VAERESQIVLGLDPDPAALWPGGLEGRSSQDVEVPPVQRAGVAILRHCLALIDAVAPACVAVKLQLARFEVLGATGQTILSALAAHAREAGLLVIADGKRGDIDVTAQAYADSLFGGRETPFGPVPGLGADMITVNPLMGRDSIEPFVAAARAIGAGVLVLVRTSNPGAADVEDLELAGGGRVWERLAGLVEDLGEDLGRPGLGGTGGESALSGGEGGLSGGEGGLSDVGAVVGATAPEHLLRARELMPSAVFLLPGVGAQGGRVEDLSPAFAPGRAAGLITASRSIAGAHLVAGGEPAVAARAEAERLRELAWGLSG